VTDNCAVCGSPTQSHRINGDAVCHGCLTDERAESVVEAVGAELRYELTVDTGLDCSSCGQRRTVREAAELPDGFYTARANHPDVEAVASVTCPACRESESYYTSHAAVSDIRRALAGRGGSA